MVRICPQRPVYREGLADVCAGQRRLQVSDDRFDVLVPVWLLPDLQTELQTRDTTVTQRGRAEPLRQQRTLRCAGRSDITEATRCASRAVPCAQCRRPVMLWACRTKR